jgi:Zn-dependent peptidase ImmA (M78 family)
VEDVPIPDFRTVRDRPIPVTASADLLDTVYVCQARQEWFRDNQFLNGEAPLTFVNTAILDDPPAEVAASMGTILDWTAKTRHRLSSWDAALTRLRESAEAAGVLVMISGIVGSNTHRKLDPDEFRGFALADPYAPVVFVNGADSKSAQVFTLAHELAHLWLGSTALSDVDPESTRRFDDERWCNQVAAELLVPMDEFVSMLDTAGGLRSQLQPLAEHFRVSTQVILGRVREAGALTWDGFMSELQIERERIILRWAVRPQRKTGQPSPGKAALSDARDRAAFLAAAAWDTSTRQEFGRQSASGGRRSGLPVTAGLALGDGAVELIVVAGHGLHGEPGFGVLPATSAVNPADGPDRSGQVLGRGGQVAGGGVLDKLWGGSAWRGDDGCATGEGFDHDEAEGLVPADRVQQGGSAAE